MGPGLPAPQVDWIFQPFARGSDTASNAFGLGLAITKHAVEQHGGRVSASTAAGGGLAVALEIPKQAGRNLEWR
ncbi:ATP-binding protein [Agrobacterium vitis]|uniref:ATP-binding protein n=1 Tax=Agrobacterium vitis TaxID=373 RepID=UPI002689089B